MRRIVICLDGTWNNAERGVEKEAGHRLFKPTNVLKIYRAVKPVGPGDTTQIAYYNEGVGAFIGEKTRLFRLQVVTDRLFGGAFGGGFEGRVKEAYRFLVGNHQPGDLIYVIGFSRGAAQAQSLVRFIDWIGGVLEKQDEYYIPELFEAFRESKAAPGEAARKITEIRERRRQRALPAQPNEPPRDLPPAIQDPKPVAIEFLGVFDTVLSLGSRLRADRREGEIHSVGPRFAFHVGPRPPAIVRVARQALAIDESRWDYRPHVWKEPASPAQSLAQMWFPGVHTNVGGGRETDGLANFALRWMIAEARPLQLELDADFLRKYLPSLKGERPLRASFFYRAVETLRGKRHRGVRQLDQGPGAGVLVHESALDLLLEEETYRPVNLLDYLADHPQATEILGGGERRSKVDAIVRDHVAARSKKSGRGGRETTAIPSR